MGLILTLVNYNSFRIVIFLALAIVASQVHVTNAKSCVAFDIDFAMYAFGLSGKDFKLGTQDTWSSPVNPTDITTAGRPPFDGPQTTCYLAQFFNAIYVLNGDNSNPTSLYIYDVQNKTWSTQAVTPGPDPSSLIAILDHDTNVFYALASGTLYSLDMGTQTQAISSPTSWKVVGTPSFDTNNYIPTMALAQNHIHFIGVPKSSPGSMYIFVIHFSYFQPTPQTYSTQGGGNPFPSTHGEAFSIFRPTGVQQNVAFIPDDTSSTYIINVESNTTLALPGPPDKSSSTYAASTQAIIQLTSTGSFSFLPYTPDSNSANLAATWNKIDVQGLPAVSSGNSSTNSSASGSATSGSGTVTASGAGVTGTTTSTKNGGLQLKICSGVAILAGVAMTLVLL